MNVTDYRLIKAYSHDDLEKKVTAAIGFGWQPQGGVCVLATDATELHCQAMVKYSPKGKSELNPHGFV